VNIANAVRLLTIILGAAVGGGMLRFYWSRRGRYGMPRPAMISFFLMLFYVLDGTWENWNSPWDWTQTPVALAAFVFVGIGVFPFLRAKRPNPKEPT
jgi:hypothetical protein